jgi:hypothetical protein
MLRSTVLDLPQEEQAQLLAAGRRARYGYLLALRILLRRWLHKVGWMCKRTKFVAKDDDPHRVKRLVRMRWVYVQLRAWEALVFADELDIHRLPKVGCACMPKGMQLAVMTPGQHQKYYRPRLAALFWWPTGTAWRKSPLGLSC